MKTCIAALILSDSGVLKVTKYIRRLIVRILLLTLFLSCQNRDLKEKEAQTLPVEEVRQTESDTLRLLVWEGYAPALFVKEFEEEIYRKYSRKISLEVSYADGSDDFFEAIRSNRADLVTISHYSIKDEKLNYIKNGLIIPPDLKNIPNFEDMIPSLKNEPYHMENGILYSIPLAKGPYGLAYNTEIFPEPPDSWSVFWENEHADKYILGQHESLYNANITALMLGYPLEEISSFTILNNEEFISRLNYLAKNAHYMWNGVDKPDDYKGMHLAMAWGDSLMELNRRGEPWKMASPREGTLWWIDDYALTQSLSEKPFMKKIAEEWINKTLSPDFQLNHIIREVGIFPVVTSIADQLTPEENDKIKPDLVNNFMDAHILQTVFSQRDRNGLELLWNQAIEHAKSGTKHD
jgi:spermidine/putrescine-binding protein